MIELIPFILYTGLQLMKHKQAKTFTCKQTNCIIIIIIISLLSLISRLTFSFLKTFVLQGDHELFHDMKSKDILRNY